MNKVLTIAGSDPSGGAGIQADLKTMTVHGVYGMSVITAITAQNTLGVSKIIPIPGQMVRAQIEAVLEDIRPEAIKIGMLANKEIVKILVELLNDFEGHIIIDPVMISTSGKHLLEEDALATFIKDLLPIATLITPNIPEAQLLSDMKILNEDDMIKASEIINKLTGSSVLIKGGHFHTASDLLNANKLTWFKHDLIANPNTHGTGCTLSSAIASNMAKGYDLETSVEKAKSYITRAIADCLDLGKGNGPLNHMIDMKNTSDD